MLLSQDAIEKILGLLPKTEMDASNMASELTLTIFPFDRTKVSEKVLSFLQILQENLVSLGVKIIPYPDALQKTPLLKVVKRFFKIIGNNGFFCILNFLGVRHGYYYIHFGAIRNLAKITRIRKGVSVIALGENEISRLPIDYTSSFVGTSIITLLDCPKEINGDTNFSAHFDHAMNIFSYHMTHLAILVSDFSWILYNFNASHPTFEIRKDIRDDLLHALIPKIAAPIKPPLLSEFVKDSTQFSVQDEPYISMVADLKNGGQKFNGTGLYPKGKKVDDLPFRNGFYKWIGKIHLDHRSGMSYGFLAKQLPTRLPELIPAEEFLKSNNLTHLSQDYLYIKDDLYVLVEIKEGRFFLKIPEVWVLTQRSGANKTSLDVKNDLLLLGLVKGRMHLRTSVGSELRSDYKPSFDTKVILAHAVGNAIVASIMKYISTENEFVSKLEHKGLAIAHWHGYIRSDLVPSGWHIHGQKNYHVACSTAQSAIYALQGKLDAFSHAREHSFEYRGDVHIEPHHGTNITFGTILELADFLIDTNSSELGNKYLVTK